MDRLPERLRDMLGWTWIGPGGHLVNYPLRGGKLMNMIGTIERNDWQVESWYTQGSNEECARDFAGWHEDVQTLIRAAPSVMKWAFMERAPRQTWSVGRATLLGDACHATLPFLAQGAVMSIEDGVVLGRCLDKYADPVEALHRYEQARVERTSAMVRGAKENTSRFHESALATEEGAIAYMESEWSRDPIRDRYDWLYRYDRPPADLPAGIRVLDLTNILSGPYAHYQMGLLGAEVIKVENPKDGDLARKLGASPVLNAQLMGTSFLAQNAGKLSVTVDLKHPEGKALFRDLVASADVLVENFRPGVMDRLGFSHEALRAANPGLIYCAISGFGQNGPLAGNPAYDQI
ncbi:hypothetical protein E4T56_gene1941, partial [Termitomyces sp. T112]